MWSRKRKGVFALLGGMITGIQSDTVKTVLFPLISSDLFCCFINNAVVARWDATINRCNPLRSHASPLATFLQPDQSASTSIYFLHNNEHMTII